MKKIKIFLASSIEDLRDDRLQVGDFIRQLNEIYLDSGVHFSLIKCEDYDNAMASGGKQQEYDREIRDSELVFFLFFRKVGAYTKHEFEVALEAFQKAQKPKIITYFKYVQSLDEAEGEVQAFMQMLDMELKHYYNAYGHVDTLKLGILMQIKLMRLDDSQIKLQDGQVCLNGKAVIKAENVPMLSGNATLRELTRQKQQLQGELNQCRSAYLEDPSPEKEESFFAASAALNRLSKELTEVEKQTLELMTTVAEMSSDGRMLTHRQKEALKQFNQGNYDAVRMILEDEERENELQRAENRAETAKNEIRGYVEEELLLIKTEQALGITTQRAEKICASYEKVMDLTEKHDLDKGVLYDYAAFLYNQKNYDAAITATEKLRWYWSNPSKPAKEEDQARVYIALGVLYKNTQRVGDAEQVYLKALEIYERLASRNPAAYQPDLAISFNNLGNLYKNTQRHAEAEQAHLKALEIRQRLAARNPATYEPDLAMSLNNLGNLYSDTQRHAEAGRAYLKAKEIYERLAAQNPDAYEPALARNLNNLGALYFDTQRHAEAERAYLKALEIRQRLAAQNPDAYEPDLAVSLNNLGNLYAGTQHHAEAERAHLKALEIYERLASRNPATYEPYLAASFNNLGNLYKDTQRHAEAERAYLKALEIYECLASQNSDAYEPDLAMSFNNLGILYKNTQRYAEAEQAHLKALEIYERLAEQNPDAYEPNLARSLNNLGNLYADTQHYAEAEQVYLKALEIWQRLAAQNPDAYEPNLAGTLWNMALVYSKQKDWNKMLEMFRRAKPLYDKLTKKHPARYQQYAKTIHDILAQFGE